MRSQVDRLGNLIRVEQQDPVRDAQGAANLPETQSAVIDPSHGRPVLQRSVGDGRPVVDRLESVAPGHQQRS